MKFKQLLLILLLALNIECFSQDESTKKMEWITKQTEYEGLPLYLRRPDYKNIWEYQSNYPILICITHEFDSVKDNGLPTFEYNKSLFNFDIEVINLLEAKSNGVIFLIETYGGARNYWFFGKDLELISNFFDDLKSKYPDKKLDIDCQEDSDWNFIKEYPVQLYKKQ